MNVVREDAFCTKKNSNDNKKISFGCFHIILIILIVFIISVIGTAWWIKSNFYASHFKPVKLNEKENVILQSKIEALENAGQKKTTNQNTRNLASKAYSENGLKREIFFTEKELNAFLGIDDPELAKRMSIDLSDDLISIKLIIPIDPDFPVLGGKNILVRSGLEIKFSNGKFLFALKGVSVSGIPLPNSWLFDLKNKNLAADFEKGGGFWSHFSKGIKDVKVKEGCFYLKLNE